LRRYPFAKKLQSQNVTKEKLRRALSYKKFDEMKFKYRGIPAIIKFLPHIKESSSKSNKNSQMNEQKHSLNFPFFCELELVSRNLFSAFPYSK